MIYLTLLHLFQLYSHCTFRVLTNNYATLITHRCPIDCNAQESNHQPGVCQTFPPSHHQEELSNTSKLKSFHTRRVSKLGSNWCHAITRPVCSGAEFAGMSINWEEKSTETNTKKMLQAQMIMAFTSSLHNMNLQNIFCFSLHRRFLGLMLWAVRFSTQEAQSCSQWGPPRENQSPNWC